MANFFLSFIVVTQRSLAAAVTDIIQVKTAIKSRKVKHMRKAQNGGIRPGQLICLETIKGASFPTHVFKVTGRTVFAL